MDKQYLDIEGSKHLTNKLKEYIQSKINNIPSGGTVDLSNYYTKAEVNNIVSNISGGSSGTGKDGVGIANMKLVNYELIITLTGGTEHNLGNIRGEKGAQGEKGADGINGFSPTVEVTNITDGHKVTITDKNGTKSFDVKDGKDGTSGSGSADLSGYYTKSEVDSKLNSIEVEPTKDLLYETVVANGGAVKNVEEVDVPAESKLSDVIMATQNGVEITSTNYLVGFNTNKTQEEFDAEFSNYSYVLAASHSIEELKKINYKNDKEIVYLLIAYTNDVTYKLYFVKQYYKSASYGTGMYMCEKKYLDPKGYKMEVSEHMKKIKYIYSAKLSHMAVSEHDIIEGFVLDSSIDPIHIIDTYITHNYSKALKTNHYSLAEWGNKLDTIKNGEKGADGFSPTVSVTETTNGHTVAITDVNGTQSFDVLNGKDGKDGASGGSSGGASVVYSTDETAIGTWIDGKTIYRKVYQIPKLDSVDGDFDRTDVNLNLEVDSIINIHPIWKYGNNSGTVIVGNYCTLGVFNDYNTSSMASTLNEQKKNEMNVTYDFGANSKKIQIWRGSSARSYSCTLVLEYTKL